MTPAQRRKALANLAKGRKKLAALRKKKAKAPKKGRKRLVKFWAWR